MTDATALQQQLVDHLTTAGVLRSPAWRRAVELTPRHELLRAGYFRRLDQPGPTAFAPVLPDDPEWLAGCYVDDSLVTQIAGTIVPADIRGEIMRQPTSSSTLPSLIVRMLEEFPVRHGFRVLHVATGSGYMDALLCHRLGDDAVTSVEIDEAVSLQARVGLSRLGHSPNLIVGDGLAGHKDGAPYDGLIATCGVREIPQEWIAQTAPGGSIVATVVGWLGASELARLTVNEDGTAEGQFLGGGVSFMLARPHLPPPLGMLPNLDEGPERHTDIGAYVLDDWTTRFVAQLAAPGAQRLTMTKDGRTEHVLLDVEAGAWSALYLDGDRWTVRQGGPTRLWDAIEEHVARWLADGAPELDQFRIKVTPAGQTVSWPPAK